MQAAFTRIVMVATLLMAGWLSRLPSQPVAHAGSTYNTLVWAEEFNSGKSVNGTRWNIQTGAGGWGNGELQTYTKSRDNLRVAGGNLTIRGLYDPATGRYTSGRINTQNKAFWTYGRIDVRAKLPTGVGSWPAIWLLPQGAKYGTTYLANGEIDIMEAVGADQNEIVASAHSLAHNPALGTTRHGVKLVPDANTAFHVYSLEWNPLYLSYQIDGVEFYRVVNDLTGYKSWPYDQPYYLILNLAVGGSWGGYKGVDAKSMPWEYAIDYVRVYR